MQETGMRIITSKAVIESFLRQDVSLHSYSIGDLDDFFWPYTTWYGWYEQGTLASLFLLYRGTDLPVILALEETRPELAARLLDAVLPELPDRFYCHVSPHLVPHLRLRKSVEPHGLHHKMDLRGPARLPENILPGFPTRPLAPSDLASIEELYRQAYPGNWFDRRMLETGRYFGAHQGSKLVSIAGIHVYSREQGIAALGNITTHPEFRSKGLGASVTAALCQQLSREVSFIGLNVKADNHAAIRCYGKLGFQVSSSYEEFMVSA